MRAIVLASAMAAILEWRRPLTAEAQRLMSDYEGSKEQGWMGSYNPEEKVIVTVVRFDSGVSSYLIGASPTPPECLEADKAEDE